MVVDSYLNIWFTNNSTKTIAYVTFDILQYDNLGKRLKSPYSNYHFNDNVYPRDTVKSTDYWVNGDTRRVDLVIKEVTFRDGSKWRP